MRVSEIRKLDVEEIKQQIVDLKRTLLNLRFQHEIGQLENPKRMLHVKKDVARLKTVLANEL